MGSLTGTSILPHRAFYSGVIGLAIAFVCMLVALSAPNSAYAATLGEDIKQGDTLRIQSKEWEEDFIVLNPTYTNTWDLGTFVLLKDYSETIEFREYTDNTDVDAYNATANFWQGSTAQQWCTDYFRSLPSTLRNAVIGVKTVDTESGWEWAGINNIDGTASYSIDKVFFLSYREYDRNKQFIPHTNSKWFLRSPYACGDLKVYVCAVIEDGTVHDFGTSWPAFLGARPAFNLNLPSNICAQKADESGEDTTWVVDMNNLQHALGQPSYTWSSDNSTCTATVICSECGEVLSEQVYAISSESSSTITYTATFTNTLFVEQTKTVNKPKPTPVTTKTALKSATAKNQIYTGKALKPAITVKDAKGNTVPASAYTVTYANNTKVGIATATVTAKKDSKYTGTVKTTFKITKPAPAPVKDTPVYWMYNKKTGENLYTAALPEKTALSKKPQWQFKKIVWYAPTTGEPVYRLVNKVTNDHHWTKSKTEANTLVKRGKWKMDFGGKPAFYSGGGKTVWRLRHDARIAQQKAGTHRFATSTGEINTLKKSKWVKESETLKATRYK